MPEQITLPATRRPVKNAPGQAWRLAALGMLSGLVVACGGGSEPVAPSGAQADAGAPPAPQATPGTTEVLAPAPGPGSTPSPAPAPAPEVTASPAPSPAPAPGLVTLNASNTCGLSNFRADLLAQINQARQNARSCGGQVMPAVAPLAWNDRLFSASAKHAQDMAQNNYFSHTSLDGRTLGQRVTAEGYNWRAVGENIAGGPSSTNAVMLGWLGSAGHCRNIMGSAFSEVAVSCVASSGSSYGRYWVMVLGAR